MFLARRGLALLEASPEDLEDYDLVLEPDNPRPMGGSRWQRLLAALKSFYSWIRTRLEESFVGYLLVCAGPEAEFWSGRGFPAGQARRAKWLTSGAQLIWRRVGIEGYDADGLPGHSGLLQVRLTPDL